jgi:hypothetical protein
MGLRRTLKRRFNGGAKESSRLFWLKKKLLYRNSNTSGANLPVVRAENVAPAENINIQAGIQDPRDMVVLLNSLIRAQMSKIFTSIGRDTSNIDAAVAAFTIFNGEYPGAPIRNSPNVSIYASSYSRWISRHLLGVATKEGVDIRPSLERLPPTAQCVLALGPDWRINRCYICARPPSGLETECEHKLAIISAISLFGLIQNRVFKSQNSQERAERSSIIKHAKDVYGNSHKCCNRFKSNLDFIKYNSTSKQYEMNDVTINYVISIIGHTIKGNSVAADRESKCTVESMGVYNATLRVFKPAAASASIHAEFVSLLGKINTILGEYTGRWGPDEGIQIYHLTILLKILLEVDIGKLSVAFNRYKEKQGRKKPSAKQLIRKGKYIRKVVPLRPSAKVVTVLKPRKKGGFFTQKNRSASVSRELEPSTSGSWLSRPLSSPYNTASESNAENNSSPYNTGSESNAENNSSSSLGSASQNDEEDIDEEVSILQGIILNTFGLTNLKTTAEDMRTEVFKILEEFRKIHPEIFSASYEYTFTNPDIERQREIMNILHPKGAEAAEETYLIPRLLLV